MHERDGRGSRVPIRPRHVCILFRRFERLRRDDISRGYVRALEARRVPHVLVGGSSFHEREEVEALRNALARSSGPTTSSRSSRRCAARSSRSPTPRC